MARRRTTRRAWTKQKAGDVKRLGADRAPWYAEWNTPDGKRRCECFGPGAEGKRAAKHAAKVLTAELVSQSYNRPDDVLWSTFVAEYTETVISRKCYNTRLLMAKSLRVFGEICKPHYVADVNAKMIDQFKTERALQKNRSGGTISPASINLDLRNIRAALNKAHEWEYSTKVPKMTFERVYFKEPRTIEPEHLRLMFDACETARMPKVAGITPAEWWRALFTLLWLTGWRISEARHLKRNDVDLESRTALTRAEDNKGKRDFRTPLHPLVVDRLMPLFVSAAGEYVFPWPHHDRVMFTEFDRIQADAWALNDGKQWEPYGFHDFRRSFATFNADKLPGDVVQQLMRHRSAATTALYIALSKQRRLSASTELLFVPDALKSPAEV